MNPPQEFRHLPIAHVLKWNRQLTEVNCPHCDESHLHLPTIPEDVHQSRIRIGFAPCFKPINVRYILKYPLEAYEIGEYNGEPCFVNRDVRTPAVQRQLEGYCLPGSMVPWNLEGRFLSFQNPHFNSLQFPVNDEVANLADLFGQTTLSSGPAASKTFGGFPVIRGMPVKKQLESWYKNLGFRREPTSLSFGKDITIFTDWATIEAQSPHHMRFRIVAVYGDAKSHRPGIVHRFPESNWVEPDWLYTSEPDWPYEELVFGREEVENILNRIGHCFNRRFPGPGPVDRATLWGWTRSVLEALLPLFGRANPPAVSPRLEELLRPQESPPVELERYMQITSGDTLKIVTGVGPNGTPWAVLIKCGGCCYSLGWQGDKEIERWRIWNTKKTFGVLLRDHNLPPVCAVSGYHPSTIKNNNYETIDGPEYSSKIMKRWTFPAVPNCDGGTAGRYHASHTEMLLLSYLMEHHLGLGRDNEGPREGLMSVAPGPRLSEATIVVSQEPCEVCLRVMELFRKAYSFRLTVSFD